MTRRMADSVSSAGIPVGVFPLVAGYLNGAISQWSQADWDRHAGHSTLVRITVFASVNAGHVLDVEKGDATPAEAPGWVWRRRAAGTDPTVYCSESAWPAVRQAFANAGVPEPHYWVAAYPGEGSTIIPSGAIAHQWIDRGPYDESIVADSWPGVDQGGTVPAEWSDQLANPLYNPTITDPADTRSHKTYAAEQYLVGSWARTLNVGADVAKVLSPQIAQVDTDTKAAQTDVDSRLGAIAATIAALPAPGQVTDTQMADLEAKLAAAFPNYNISFTKA